MGLRFAAVLSLTLSGLAGACTVVSSSEPQPGSEEGRGDAGKPGPDARASSGDSGPTEDTGTGDTPDAAGSSGCEAALTPPPATLQLDAFYTKYLDAHGVPVVSSAAPSDDALRVVCRLAVRMMQKRDDVRLAAIERSLRIGVMGIDQVTTDMPEHADLNEVFPATDWDERARGLGATVDRPLSSCAEENVSCLAGDRYVGENIFVHEFSHSLYGLGVVHAEPAFAGRLRAAYEASLEAGRWANTYAAENADEYWAEGVQSFLGVNLESIPSNGIHNEIDTRAELETYDPALFELVAEIFEPVDLPLCP